MFTPPQYVPKQMEEMCNNLKNDLNAAKATAIDPISLATKYSLEFVTIHPFQDGNGRMCRLILNAILFRFIGVVAPIGKTEEDIAEYIGIKRRASESMEGHGEYATFVLGKVVRSLQRMKKKVRGKQKRPECRRPS